MKDKRNSNIIKEPNKTIIAVFIPMFIICLIEIIFKVANLGILYIFWGETNSMIFSILIGYLIFGIFMGITKKLSISTNITFIIGTLLLLINQIKLIYTGEPIYFSDINFIKNIKNIFELVQGYLMVSVKNFFFCICSFIMCFLLYQKVDKK